MATTKTSQVKAGRCVRVRFDDEGVMDGIVTDVMELGLLARRYRAATVLFPADGSKATVYFSQIEKIGPRVNIPAF